MHSFVLRTHPFVLHRTYNANPSSPGKQIQNKLVKRNKMSSVKLPPGATRVFPAPPVDDGSLRPSASTIPSPLPGVGPKFVSNSDDSGVDVPPEVHLPMVGSVPYLSVETPDGFRCLPQKGAVILVEGIGVVPLEDFLSGKLKRGVNQESLAQPASSVPPTPSGPSTPRAEDQTTAADVPMASLSTEAAAFGTPVLDTPLPDDVDAMIQSLASRGYNFVLKEIKDITPDNIDPLVDEAGEAVEDAVEEAVE